MAKRRSARLQKAAKSTSPDPPVNNKPTSQLSTVNEQNEPSAVASTPEKSTMAAFSSVTTRTPRHRTPMKASNVEMHPGHHHPTTTKPLEEAPWLGFFAQGAHTAPSKDGNEPAILQNTPTKASPAVTGPFSTSQFMFRHKGSSMELSPETRRQMEDKKRTETPTVRAQLFAGRTDPSTAVTSPRKMAKPKGKASRFSDIHMAQFKKMDSIASHPSLLRTDPSRFSPVKTSLKRSPSKAELDVIDNPKVATTPRNPPPSPTKLGKPTPTLVRTKSAMRLGYIPSEDMSGQAKRIKRHVDDDASTTRTIPKTIERETNISRYPHKPALRTPGSAIPLFNSRLLTPTKASLGRARSGQAVKTLMRSPPKRMPIESRSLENAGTAMSTEPRGFVASVLQSPPKRMPIESRAIEQSALRSPGKKALEQLVLLSPAKRMVSGTRLFEESTKPTEFKGFEASTIRSLPKRIPMESKSFEDSMRDGVRKMSRTLFNNPAVKSILRTPHRKFSNDPTKIAAGTHMSPPPGIDFHPELEPVPATVPVRKHVNFTASALAKDEPLATTPSRKHTERAASEVPQPSIVTYPTLPTDDVSDPAGTSPSRRMTLGDVSGTMPGSSTFRSDNTLNFGPATSGLQRAGRRGTIRPVTDSDVYDALVEAEGKGKKRKLDNVEDPSDKENDEEEARSSKKQKSSQHTVPGTPSSASKLPRRPIRRMGSLTPARLNLLAAPKRRPG